MIHFHFAGLMIPRLLDTTATCKRETYCGLQRLACVLVGARGRSFSAGDLIIAFHPIVWVALLLIVGCAGEERRPPSGAVVVPRGGGSIGVPWEAQFSSKSAVRFRDEIAVAAQLGWDEHGRVAGAIDAQTHQAYANVIKALETGGGTLRDVVDETIFVTDMTAALTMVPAIRRALYGSNPIVASTMVEVKRLSDPNAQIAIKVTAKLDIPLPRGGGPQEGPPGGGRGRGRGMGGGMGGGGMGGGGGRGGGGPF